jgi:hypothetical protein
VLQCINGVSLNPVEGRTKICQLKDLILTLFGLIFRRVYIYNIRTLSVNIKFICTSFRNKQAFQACFAASTNEFYI